MNSCIMASALSIHFADEVVDELLTIAPVAATLLAEAVALANEAALGGGKLEGPQEVADLLELRPRGIELVDHILHSMDAFLAQCLRDDFVRRERDTLLVNLAIATLVHK